MVKMICTRVVHARDLDGVIRLHATFREWDPPEPASPDRPADGEYELTELDFEPEVGDFYDLTPEVLARRLPRSR